MHCWVPSVGRGVWSEFALVTNYRVLNANASDCESCYFSLLIFLPCSLWSCCRDVSFVDFLLLGIFSLLYVLDKLICDCSSIPHDLLTFIILMLLVFPCLEWWSYSINAACFLWPCNTKKLLADDASVTDLSVKIQFWRTKNRICKIVAQFSYCSSHVITVMGKGWGGVSSIQSSGNWSVRFLWPRWIYNADSFLIELTYVISHLFSLVFLIKKKLKLCV